MCDIALVEDTTEEIYKYSDDADNGEDGTRAHGLLCGLGCDAGSFGEDFEVV